jgi:hypothetical protein
VPLCDTGVLLAVGNVKDQARQARYGGMWRRWSGCLGAGFDEGGPMTAEPGNDLSAHAGPSR